MTNRYLKEFYGVERVSDSSIPNWSERAKEKVGHVDRDRYDATSQILARETPISKWICEQIEERKRNMNYQLIYNIQNHPDDVYVKVGTNITPVEVRDITVEPGETRITVVEKGLVFKNVGGIYHRIINPIALGEKTIERVIFHDPATIVIWKDGTKTVVKTQNGEKYDPEKGLAMAITKKALGNEGNYYNTFTKWLKESEEVEG